jgi:hypothetical protein
MKGLLEFLVKVVARLPAASADARASRIVAVFAGPLM